MRIEAVDRDVEHAGAEAETDQAGNQLHLLVKSEPPVGRPSLRVLDHVLEPVERGVGLQLAALDELQHAALVGRSAASGDVFEQTLASLEVVGVALAKIKPELFRVIDAGDTTSCAAEGQRQPLWTDLDERHV